MAADSESGASPEDGVRESQDAKPAPRLQLSLADFELLRRIGDGSYSHVVLARHRETGVEYALKVVDKQYILRHKVVEYIKNERQLLDQLRHEGIARLHFTFQDAFSLYLGLEHCPNGELYDQIRLRGRLDEAAARFYAAEVVQMLEHLRQHRVVHRDLKPENLLLDASGHLKLIDFGSAKMLPPEEVVPGGRAHQAAADGTAGSGCSSSKAGGSSDGSSDTKWPGEAAADDLASALPTPSSSGSMAADEARAADALSAELAAAQPAGQQQAEAGQAVGSADSLGSDAGEEARAAAGAEDAPGSAPASPSGASKRQVSLVGTADYVSPEILNNCSVSCAADLWALGCVLYQMFAGRPPFKSPSEYLTFQKIVEAEYELPEGLPPAAADLITRLLALEPADRIGAADLAELRAHPFFEGVPWDSLRSQEAPEWVQDPMLDSLSSANSSFDWELQSLASALPSGREDHLPLD